MGIKGPGEDGDDVRQPAPQKNDALRQALREARKHTSLIERAVTANESVAGSIHYHGGTSYEDLKARGIRMEGEWMYLKGGEKRTSTPVALHVSREGNEIILESTFVSVHEHFDTPLKRTRVSIYRVQPGGDYRAIDREQWAEIGGENRILPESTLPSAPKVVPAGESIKNKTVFHDDIGEADLKARGIDVEDHYIAFRKQVSPHFSPLTYQSAGFEPEETDRVEFRRVGDDIVIRGYMRDTKLQRMLAPKRVKYIVHPDGTVTTETEMLGDNPHSPWQFAQ